MSKIKLSEETKYAIKIMRDGRHMTRTHSNGLYDITLVSIKKETAEFLISNELVKRLESPNDSYTWYSLTPLGKSI